MMNTNKPEREPTGYPSIDKPWQKFCEKHQFYYKIEDISIYDYLKQMNEIFSIQFFCGDLA